MLLGRDLPRLYDRLRPWKHFTDVTETTVDAFKVMLDVNPFRPEELSVRLTENGILVIEGRHQETCDEKKISAGLISRHFERRYRIPQRADWTNLVSAMSNDGILTVKAPRLNPEQPTSNERVIPIQIMDKKSQSETVKSSNISTSAASNMNKENYLNAATESSNKSNQNTNIQQDLNINVKDQTSNTQKMEESTKTSSTAAHCMNFASVNYQDCMSSNCYKVDECSSIASPPPSICSNAPPLRHCRGVANSSVEIEELKDTASTCSTATTTNNNDDYIQIVSALKTATYENSQKTGGSSAFGQQSHHCSNIWCNKSPRVRIVPIKLEDDQKKQ